jgi:hypothetical protein
MCSLPITLHIKETEKNYLLTKAKVTDANIFLNCLLFRKLSRYGHNSPHYRNQSAMQISHGNSTKKENR